MTLKITMIAAMAFFAKRVVAQDEPFEQMYMLIALQDWSADQLPGAVLDYQAPMIGGYGDGMLKDVDWGARSIGFTMDLPLRPDIEGIYGRETIELYCHQRSVAAIFENIAQIGDRNLPPRILRAAQASSAGPASYIRQCEGIARMRYIREGRLGATPALYLCADAIQVQFSVLNITETLSSADNYTMEVVATEVAAVETRDGIALGARCQQHNHPYSPMSFVLWYMR